MRSRRIYTIYWLGKYESSDGTLNRDYLDYTDLEATLTDEEFDIKFEHYQSLMIEDNLVTTPYSILDLSPFDNWGSGSDELELADVDGNGKIDASDAAVVLVAAAKLGAGEDSGLTPAQMIAADVNKDGKYDAADAAIILSYCAAIGAGESNVTLEDFV